MDTNKAILELISKLEELEAGRKDRERSVADSLELESKRMELRDKEREKRANRVLAILAGAVGIVAPVLTGTAVYATNDNISEGLGSRVVETERKIQRLGERIVEQEIQLVESVRYLGDKIDSANPEAAYVPKPPAVQAGEDRVEKLMRTKRVEELLAEPLDPENPLKDTGP